MKKSPNLKLVNTKVSEASSGDVTDESFVSSFKLITISELTGSEQSRVKKIVSQIAPRATIIGIAVTPRAWDIRPVVINEDEKGPTVIRFLGPEVTLSLSISGRVHDNFERLLSMQSQGIALSGAETIVDWGVLEGQIWYRRELVNKTLATLLEVETSLNYSDFLSFAIKSVAEVSNWHARGFPHGHLTDSNIAVSASGEVGILDAGVGVAVVQASRWLQVDTFPQGYDDKSFAPESLGNESVLFASDVFCLGRLLQRLLRRLGDKYQVNAPISDPYARSSALKPLHDIFSRMTDPDPKRRPLLSDVKKILDQTLPTYSGKKSEESTTQGSATEPSTYNDKPSREDNRRGKIVHTTPAADAPLPQPAAQGPAAKFSPEARERASNAGFQFVAPPGAIPGGSGSQIEQVIRQAAEQAAEQAIAKKAVSPAHEEKSRNEKPQKEKAQYQTSWPINPVPENVETKDVSKLRGRRALPPLEHPCEPQSVQPSALKHPVKDQPVQQPPAQRQAGKSEPLRRQKDTDYPAAYNAYGNVAIEPDWSEPESEELFDIPSRGDESFFDTPPKQDRATARDRRGTEDLYARKPNSSIGNVIFGVLCIAGVALATFTLAPLMLEPEEVQIPNDQLRSQWESGLPSLMVTVAESAIDKLNPNSYAEMLIVTSARNGKMPAAGGDIGLLRIAFDDHWESELSSEDRRAALILGTASLLGSRTPHDIPSLDLLHPGIIFAVVASSNEGVSKALSRVPASILSKLPAPYGAAFGLMVRANRDLSCAAPEIRTLARLASRGIEDASDVITFLSGSPKETQLKLLSLSHLYSRDDKSARQLLDLLLNRGLQTEFTSPLILWAEKSKLLSWRELSDFEQLLLLAGLPPPPTKELQQQNIARLFGHPEEQVRKYAFEQALRNLAFPQRGSRAVLEWLKRHPGELNDEQTLRVAYLLSAPERSLAKESRDWDANLEQFLANNPPVEIVSRLLLASAEDAQDSPLGKELCNYLKKKNYQPSLGDLRVLIGHPNTYTRLYAYQKVWTLEDRESAISILLKARKREQDQEARKLLEMMLSNLRGVEN